MKLAFSGSRTRTALPSTGPPITDGDHHINVLAKIVAVPLVCIIAAIASGPVQAQPPAGTVAGGVVRNDPSMIELVKRKRQQDDPAPDEPMSNSVGGTAPRQPNIPDDTPEAVESPPFEDVNPDGFPPDVDPGDAPVEPCSDPNDPYC